MGRRAVWQWQRAALRAACGRRRATGGGGRGACSGWQAAAATMEMAMRRRQRRAAMCGDVRLFSSCGDSNVIRYPIFNFAFFVPGELETVGEKRQD
jgi:hypothetical protein